MHLIDAHDIASSECSCNRHAFGWLTTLAQACQPTISDWPGLQDCARPPLKMAGSGLSSSSALVVSAALGLLALWEVPATQQQVADFTCR